jgi:hypothetical protein
MDSLTMLTQAVFHHQSCQLRGDGAPQHTAPHSPAGPLSLQNDVEQFYIRNGYLLPSFHRSYWIGYQTSTPGVKPPNFTTVDMTLDRSRYRQYRWGTYFENGKASAEPNNIMNPEFCVVANFSMTFGSPPAWGWADQSCGQRFPFMCRNYSEWHDLATR